MQEKEILNLLQKILSPIIETQNEILKTQQVILNRLNNDNTSKPIKTPKDKTLEYNDILQAFFDSKQVQYNSQLSPIDNMNILCNSIQENINLYTLNKLIYSNTDKHYNPVDYNITNKGIVNKNHDFTTKINPNTNTEPLNTEAETLCNIFKIKKSNNEFDIATTIIRNSFKNKSLENLTEEEIYVNNNCYSNAIYLKQDNLYVKEAYSYDINSFHGYMLKQQDFIFPIRKGTKCILDKINPDQIGVYAIAIKDPILFFQEKKINPNKVWHTNYTIKLLIENNIRFKLLECDKADYNAIIYNDHDCIRASTVFEDSINKLYNESHNNKLAKTILTKMFGIMTSASAETIVKSKDDDIDFNEIDMNTLQETNGTLSYKLKNDNGFKYPTARIKIFFYDYAKYWLYNNYLKEHKDDIIRIYVDSFMLTKKLPKKHPRLSNDMGDIKRELMLKNVIIPNVTFSFKNKEMLNNREFVEEDEEIYKWNKKENVYESII